MIYRLSKSIRRVLAVALLALVVLLVGLVAVAPWWSHVADLQDRIEQERKVAARLAARPMRPSQVRGDAIGGPSSASFHMPPGPVADG